MKVFNLNEIKRQKQKEAEDRTIHDLYQDIIQLVSVQIDKGELTDEAIVRESTRYLLYVLAQFINSPDIEITDKITISQNMGKELYEWSEQWLKGSELYELCELGKIKETRGVESLILGHD